MSFSIKIDYRENRGADVISAISKLRTESAIVAPEKYDVVVEGLTVGDFILSCGKYVLIIERKTLADLASSICDRRIYNNHEKLIGAKSDMPELIVRIMYMIEGKRDTQADTKFSGIAFSSLIAKLDHITMLDGCSIDWTQNCAVRLLELGKNMLSLASKNKGDPVIQTTEGGAHDDIDVSAIIEKSVKKSFVKPINEVQMNMIKCIKTVGQKTTEKLLESHKFSEIIVGTTEIDCVGPKIIDEIRAVRSGERPACIRAMLCEIKGVSTKIADLILMNTTMAKLATDFSVDELASLKNESGRKVGSALAKRIIETLRS